MRTASTIRLVTVDSQAVFRAGISAICSAFPNIAVAGEGSRSADAMELCERLRPNLLLLDGGLPGALSVLVQLREHHPDVGVLLLADQLDEALLRRGLQLGVVGYLLRQIESFDLTQAIRSAARGLLTLAPEAIVVLASQDDAAQDALSEREQAVLALLLQGCANDAIAARLQISRSTVKFHLRNIYMKLGVSSRVEALALVYRQRRGTLARLSEPLPELLRPRTLAVAV